MTRHVWRRSPWLLLIAGVMAALLAAPASAGGGGGGCGQPTTDAATTTVGMDGNCFGPTVARVEPGATVTFVNDSQLPHTVTAAGMQWGSLDHLQPTATLGITFDTPGVFPFVCVLHPGMVGAVVVGDQGDTPLAAGADVTAGDPTRASEAAWLVLGAASGLTLGVVGAGLALRRRRVG